MRRQTVLLALTGLLVVGAASVVVSLVMSGVAANVASHEAQVLTVTPRPSQGPSQEGTVVPPPIATAAPTTPSPEVTVPPAVPTPAVPTTTPTLVPEKTPTPAASPVPGADPCAHARELFGPPSLTMRLEGPSQARPGEQVTYRLSYELVDLESTIRIEWSPGASYVSAERLSGSGGSVPEPAGHVDGRIAQLAWGVQKGSGVLAFTLSVPEDATLDTVFVRAWVSGVCGPRSNGASTAIVRG